MLASLDEDAHAPPLTLAKSKSKKKGKRTKAVVDVPVAAFPAIPSSGPASPAARNQHNSPIASPQLIHRRTSAGHAAASAAEQGSVGRKPPRSQPHSPAASEAPQQCAAAQNTAGRDGGPGAGDPQESGWVRVVKGSGSRRCANQAPHHSGCDVISQPPWARSAGRFASSESANRKVIRSCAGLRRHKALPRRPGMIRPLELRQPAMRGRRHGSGLYPRPPSAAATLTRRQRECPAHSANSNMQKLGSKWSTRSQSQRPCCSTHAASRMVCTLRSYSRP